MRILVVCSYYKPAFVYGGPVNALSSLCEGFSRTGNEVTVFTTNANGSNVLEVPCNKEVKVEGVNVWYFSLLSRNLPYFLAPEMGKALKIRIKEFDIVIAEGLWDSPMIMAARQALKYHIPYIVPIYGQLNPWAYESKGFKKKIYMKFFARHYLNLAAGIICETPLENETIKKFGFRSPNIVIPSGLDTKIFQMPRNSGNFRQRHKIPEKAIVLLFLGRLAKIKRPDIAIDTLAALQSDDREVHLILAGPDEDGLLVSLKNQASNLGCSKRIHITGLLDRKEVLEALANTDLYLMPTEIQENFGNAALEALAAGVPILVSEGVPLGKWAEKNHAGRSEICDSESFQKATKELLQNPENLTIMGERGRIFAEIFFDINVIVKTYIEHFQSIIDNGYPLTKSYFERLF